MIIEITGDVSKNGMIIDFFELNEIVSPIIDKFDHAFLCSKDDTSMADFLGREDMKKVLVEYSSTVENICNDIACRIGEALRRNSSNKNIASLCVRVFETPDSFAETTLEI